MEVGDTWEACEQGCKVSEDEDLIAQLREKYGQEKNLGTATGANAIGIGDGRGNAKSQKLGVSQASSMKVHYTICSTCQGSGRKTETYNFRVLESDCPKCHGECIVNTCPEAASGGKENSGDGENEQQCICLRCRKMGSEDSMFCCSRCKTSVYCGKDCQVKDWSNHRLACRRAAS